MRAKVLLLKLLLSCPNIGIIYVLIRAKNNESSEERLTSLLNKRPFTFYTDKEHNANHVDVHKNVCAIKGDITKDGLALSQSDRQLLCDNVHIVFNCAASVKLDEPLK